MQECQTHDCYEKAAAKKSRDIHGVPIEYYVCAYHNDQIDAAESGREPIYDSPEDAPTA